MNVLGEFYFAIPLSYELYSTKGKYFSYDMCKKLFVCSDICTKTD